MLLTQLRNGLSILPVNYLQVILTIFSIFPPNKLQTALNRLGFFHQKFLLSILDRKRT